MTEQNSGELDNFGRPHSLPIRLVAYTAILSQANLTSSRSNLMNLAFWDEAISPAIGCEVQTIGFEKLGDGVRSVEMSEILDRAVAQDMLVPDWVSHGQRDPALYPSNELVAAAEEMKGTAWFLVLSQFVSGFTRFEGGSDGIGPMTESQDINEMMSVDPVYISMSETNAWNDGPARAAVDLSIINPEFCGNAANAAVGLILNWMVSDVESGADSDISAPISGSLLKAVLTYGRFLVSQASRKNPRFGESDYIRNLERIRARLSGEMSAGDLFVTTEFLDSNQVVAVCEVHIRPEEGVLRSLRVTEGFEGRGFGTLALRHAMSQGARKAAVPVYSKLAGMLLKHGNMVFSGDEIRLCEVSWPACTVLDDDALAA